jgi:hypothetical protein
LAAVEVQAITVAAEDLAPVFITKQMFLFQEFTR